MSRRRHVVTGTGLAGIRSALHCLPAWDIPAGAGPPTGRVRRRRRSLPTSSEQPGGNRCNASAATAHPQCTAETRSTAPTLSLSATPPRVGRAAECAPRSRSTVSRCAACQWAAPAWLHPPTSRRSRLAGSRLAVSRLAVSRLAVGAPAESPSVEPFLSARAVQEGVAAAATPHGGARGTAAERSARREGGARHWVTTASHGHGRLLDACR